MTTIKPIQLQTKTGQQLQGLRCGHGHPVLALHGWLDNVMSFAPMLNFFRELDVVGLDFPGHGLSAQRPKAARYHFDDYVFDALQAADELGWARFHLIGHSLGGAVASVLSAACPDRISSLTVIEGLGPLSAATDQTARGWQRAVQISRDRPRKVHASRDEAVEARMRNSDLKSEAAALLAERGLEFVDQGWQWRHDQRLTWPSSQRYTEAQVLDLLSHIRAPSLCLLADPPSRIMPAGLFERRFAAVRNLNTARWPGGHHLHMEYPEPVAARIQQHILESEHDAA